MEPKQNTKQSKTLCFVAGKSGGHIIPCLTLAQRYQKKNSAVSCLFFSANTHLDKTILSDKLCINQQVRLSIAPFAYKKIYSYPLIIIQLFSSFIASLYYLHRHKPMKIISTGGIIALPVCFAAFVLRIPITLYELNAIPGKSIKFLSLFAQHIWYCFDETQAYLPKNKRKKKAYPIRFSSPKISPQQAKKKLSLCPEKKTITILGGSQGSLFINNLMKQWLVTVPHRYDVIQIIHQTGINDKQDWEQLYNTLSISASVFSYQDNPVLSYLASDLILCRAGAGTLFEIHFFGKECITIPLATATTSHQINNAYAMATKYPRHFRVLEQKNLGKNPEQLFSYLNKLYSL